MSRGVAWRPVKRTPSCLTTLAVCLALGAAWAVPTVSDASTTTLSSREYSLLLSGEAKLQQALTRKPVSWAAVRAACRGVGTSTALLKSERASCVDETQLFEGLANFPRQEGRCGSAQPHKDICVVPLYKGLTKDAEAMYRADAVTYQRAAQRGFTGRCIDALANTKTQLGQQRQLATATANITSDVELAAKVSEGKLPSGAITVATADADAKAFERDADVVLAQSSPKVSSCPHQ